MSVCLAVSAASSSRGDSGVREWQRLLRPHGLDGQLATMSATVLAASSALAAQTPTQTQSQTPTQIQSQGQAQATRQRLRTRSSASSSTTRTRTTASAAQAPPSVVAPAGPQDPGVAAPAASFTRLHSPAWDATEPRPRPAAERSEASKAVAFDALTPARDRRLAGSSPSQGSTPERDYCTASSGTDDEDTTQPPSSQRERPNGPRKHSASVVSAELTRPSLVTKESVGDRPRTSPGLEPGSLESTLSTTLSPTNSSSVEPRSPLAKSKRAPASRSSHGIATSRGPPPALSTQRSYNTGLAQQAEDLAGPATGDGRTAEEPRRSFDADRRPPREPASSRSRSRRSSGRTDDGMDRPNFPRYGEDLLDDDRDRTLRALEGAPGDDRRYAADDGVSSGRPGLERAPSGGEDVFLNIARATSVNQGDGPDGSARGERRRSRMGLSSQRQSLPQASFSSPLARAGPFVGEARTQGQPLNEQRYPSHARRTSQGASPTITHSALGRNRSSAASAHPLDDVSRARYFGGASRTSYSGPRNVRDREAERDVSPGSSPYEGRSPSTLEGSANGHRGHAYRQSNLSYASARDDERWAERRQPHDEYAAPTAHLHTASESTVSTTPVSNVWDELDQLKSRIHTLEASKEDPSFSNTSGDRPRTATTTVTTVSSSPRANHGKSVSVGGLGSPSFHPLLHAALIKSKPILSPDAYRALEATASDALSIAASAQGGPAGSGSVVGGGVGSDRMLRRKADSMCRSLTELCIALAEGKADGGSPGPRRRPLSRDVSGAYGQADAGQEASPYAPQQRDGQDPDPLSLARSNSRALSRVEARRSSLMAMNGGNSPRTPVESSTPTAPTNFSNPARDSRRSSAVLRNLGLRPGAADGVDDNASESGFRAPSRAATEIGHGHGGLRASPREYTSQHPMPVSSQRAPSAALPSSLPLRRHYGSASLSMAGTPPSAAGQAQPGSRRYLDRGDGGKPGDEAGYAGSSVGVGGGGSGSSGLSRTTSLGRKQALGSARFTR
ncbi:MAG: hypothetical protein M1832_000926 [Thelocarpon impressellum]|nr:MAG: hypothetical protein M1832_000926 [Thelocarpon impressellum]